MDGVDPDIITTAETAASEVPGVRHLHAGARWAGRTLRVEIEGWLDAATGQAHPAAKFHEGAFAALAEARRALSEPVAELPHRWPRAKKLAVAAGQFWSPGRCSLVLREMRLEQDRISRFGPQDPLGLAGQICTNGRTWSRGMSTTPAPSRRSTRSSYEFGTNQTSSLGSRSGASAPGWRSGPEPSRGLTRSSSSPACNVRSPAGRPAAVRAASAPPCFRPARASRSSSLQPGDPAPSDVRVVRIAAMRRCRIRLSALATR